MNILSKPYFFQRRTAGNVLHFTGGATSKINCGAIYNTSTKLWVSLWFKLDSNFTAASSSQDLICKALSGDDFIEAYLQTATGQLRVLKYTGAVSSFDISSTQTSWTAGQWYHVIISISSAAGVRLRINNGTAVTNADASAICNGGSFIIGSYNAGSGSGFIGQIQNVIVGTDDLTTAEEDALFNGTTPADATDHWYIDEGIGTVITSYGTSANTGTAGAACTWMVDRLPFLFR